MKNVIAVVVTHNRYQSLINCIEAIRSQTTKPDQILVINNGSSDYTSVWLDQQEDIIHIYQENTGSSGGFHTGISWSHQHQFNWVWCMEDDSYPHEKALENLLHNYNADKTFLRSSIMMHESDRPKEIINPFNGTLIHHSIISKVGLPNSTLFSKGAEAEYFYRITRKHNFSSKTVSESIHFHSTSSMDFYQEWNLKSSVDLYFMLRNQYEVNKSKYNYKALAIFHYMAFICQFLITIVSKQKNQKWSKILFVVRAMVDGFKGNYNISTSVVQQRINRLCESSARENFIYSVRNLIINLFVPSFSEMQKTT